MRAMVAGAAGLEMRDVPAPAVGPGQVLVRVQATGLNRAELAMASGASHGGRGGAGKPVGLEWSGEVMELGPDVPPGYRVGQRVMCTGGGAWAELAVTDWGRVSVMPEGLGWVEAAALPTALQTAHNAFVLGHLAKGETALVHGASSGVGLMALQVAGELGAGLVIGSSGNAERRARLSGFGAELVVDSSQAGWSAAVLEATGGRGADMVMDLVGGPSLSEVMRATSLQGRIINNGRLGGNEAAFDLDLHATRRITLIGSSFRTRTVAEVREINRRMREDLWPALEAGRLRMPIDSVFPLERAAEAQARMRSNQHFGKIVLTV